MVYKSEGMLCLYKTKNSISVDMTKTSDIRKTLKFSLIY